MYDTTDTEIDLKGIDLSFSMSDCLFNLIFMTMCFKMNGQS